MAFRLWDVWRTVSKPPQVLLQAGFFILTGGVEPAGSVTGPVHPETGKNRWKSNFKPKRAVQMVPTGIPVSGRLTKKNPN
jgi:hypothetical protein